MINWQIIRFDFIIYNQASWAINSIELEQWVDKNVPESAKITEAINETIVKMQGAFSLKNTGQISNAEF